MAGLSFVTESSSAPNTLLLSGNGVLVPGTLSFIPGVVDFGDVTVGDNVSQGVVLSNSGRGPVNVSAVSVNGAGFSVGGFSLPVVLAAGASTTFGVNFSPLAAGSSTASVSVTSDASNSPASLSLTGNGISAVGTLVLTPASVDFGDVTVGASQARTITLGNSGSGTVTVSEAQAVGSAFSVSGIPLPLVLVGGGSATFSVSFAPVAGGSVAGSVTLVSNASNAPSFLSLTGNGLAATGTLSFSSTTLNFVDVVVGTGATRAVTLTNSGEGGVTITQADLADGADFSLGVLPLPLTLSSGQTTTFPVAFTPATVGAQSATLSLVSDASNSPTTLSVTGNGVSPAESGQLTVHPVLLDFGDVPVGNSLTQTVALTNSGSAALTVSGAVVSGGAYSINGLSLPRSLAVGETASFGVTFSPQSAGTVTDSLLLSTDASNSPVTMPLTGTGTVLTGALSLTPGSLNFGDILVGTADTQVVTLTNTGNADVTITDSILTGGIGFSTSQLSLPLTLAAGQSISFSVTFSPSAAGFVTGSVSFISDAANSPTTFSLSGTGLSAPTPGQLSLDPSGVDFGNVTIGNSGCTGVTLSNPGGSTISISNANVSGADFSLNGLTFPVTIAPGGTTTANVTFSPSVEGSVAGSISLLSDASNSPTPLPLTGNGILAVGTLVLTPASVDYGDVTVGATQARTITLTNSGSGTVTVSEAQAVGSAFSVSGIPLPLVLVGGGSATFSVSFAPVAGGSVAGSVTLVSNASNAPNFIFLTGNGLVATGTLNPNPGSIDFGPVPVGNNLTQTVALTNSGSAALTVSGAVVSGGAYSINGLSLPRSLAVGETATFGVTFSPQSAGTITDSLLLTSDASNAPVTIPLTGTGTVLTGALSLTPGSLDFGDILVGAADTQVVTLSNTGSGAVTVGGMSVSGTDVSVTGISIPLTLGPDESSAFNVIIVPSSAGNLTGNVTFSSDASHSPTLLSLAWNGLVATGTLNPIPGSIDFGDVPVGNSLTQTVALTNSGNASLTVGEISVIGTEFSVTGMAIPWTLGVGESATLSVAFEPPLVGSVTGSISLTSDAAISPTLILLAGNGVSSNGLLSLTPASLDFGDVTVGSSATRSVTLTSLGSTVVLVSTSEVTGAEFSVAGLALPLNLSPGETVTFSLTLTPTAAGSVNGNVALASDASNSPTVVSLTGNGIDAVTSHVVGLLWDPSISVVDGYNVYRSTVSGGPYTKINATLVPQTTFADDTVQAGVTYFYVVVAVDAGGVQSRHSNEAQASIP